MTKKNMAVVRVFRSTQNLKISSQLLGCRLMSTESRRTTIDGNIDLDGVPRGPWYLHMKPPLRFNAAKLLWSSQKNFSNESPLQVSPAKPMKDSYVHVSLPFRTDNSLRDEYINFAGNIRLGKLLEDLDAMAGTIAYRHADDHNPTTRPPTIVTASVDRILLLSQLQADRNMQMRGHVTHVGNSSMEVHIVVESEQEGTESSLYSRAAGSAVGWQPLLMADFVMVARDIVTEKATAVNKLVIGTELEQKVFDRGMVSNRRKREEKRHSLLIEAPTPDERLTIHQLYLEALKFEPNPYAKPSNIVFSSDMVLDSTKIVFPQDRNIHGKLFGGIVLREGYELAYALACLYSQSTPIFLAQDDIQFQKAVAIGSILNFSAQVVLARGEPHRSFQIAVTAKLIDPTTGSREQTTVFSFTFISPPSGPPLRRVLPRTYAESIKFLEANRRMVQGVHWLRQLEKEVVPWILPESSILV